MSVLKSDQTQKISSLKTHNDDNNNNGKSNISTRVTKTGKPEYQPSYNFNSINLDYFKFDNYTAKNENLDLKSSN